MTNILAGVGLVLTPLISRYSVVFSSRSSKDSFFYILAIIFMMTAKKEGRKPYLAVLLSILVFNSFFFTYNYLSLRYFMQHVFFCVGAVFFYHLATSRLSLKRLIPYIRTLGIIQTMLVIFNHFGCDLYIQTLFYLWSDHYAINPEISYRIVGSLGNENTIGALIGMTAPAFLGSWLMVIPLIGVILTKSSMALITVIGCYAYYFYNKNYNKYLPWVAFSIAAVLFGFLGFPGGYFSDSNRLKVWKISVNLLDGVEWLSGRGLGAFSEAMKEKPIPFIYNHIHNEYLEALHAFGLVGLLIITTIVILSIKRTNNNIILCGMFATAINCYGNFTFHISATAFLGLIYFALAYKDSVCQEVGTVGL